MNMAEQVTTKSTAASVPPLFQELTQQGSIAAGDVQCTSDGFFAVTKSIADILIGQGICSLQSVQGQILECDHFFDDWHLYALPQGAASVYGLFKMREQEYDAENGVTADGDTPGVTISFIAFRMDALMHCLSDPTTPNQTALEQELNRVVASRGQRHHPAMKDYFKRSQAQGPYLVADLYVSKIASLAQSGSFPVPKCYAARCRELSTAKFPEGKGGSLPSLLPIMKQPGVWYAIMKRFSFRIPAVCPSTKHTPFWQPIPQTHPSTPLPPKYASTPDF